MLLAVDTNVLARAMIDDGSPQSTLARQCLLENPHFIADTVLLETEWLLRSIFRLKRDEINRLFSNLIASENATFRNRNVVAMAILSHRTGLDFADAMHVLSAEGCTEFVTFDAELIDKASIASSGIVVRQPWSSEHSS